MLKLCVPVHVFKEEYIQISLTVQFFCFYLVPTDPGGGVLTIMAYMGRLRPKGVPFRLQVKGRDFTSLGI